MVGIIQCIRALISPHRSPEGGVQALGRDRTLGPITLDQCQGPVSSPDRELSHTHTSSLTHPATRAHTHSLLHMLAHTHRA